jgi:hypothetical protein
MNWLSATNIGTIIMDGATVLLLVGMMLYTKRYRERGRSGDKLFFGMMILVLIAALFDGMNFFLEESPFAFKGGLLIFGDTVFSLAYEIFPFLYILYLLCLRHWDEKKIAKRRIFFAIPAAVAVLIVLGNALMYLIGQKGYLFYIDEAGAYQYGAYYDIINIIVGIYLIFILYELCRINLRYLLAVVILVAARVGLRMIIRGVSATSFVLAVFLVYAHIQMMNDEFYEEERA